jgi:hypothetical protein
MQTFTRITAILLALPVLGSHAAAQGMGGGFGGAGAMTAERMRRSRPADFRLLRQARNSDVVVVRGTYDHAQTVLDAVRIRYTLIEPEDLERVELNAGQLLLVNCPGTVSRLAIKKMRQFVAAGGYLFTTDWSLQNILEPAFPGYVEYTRRPTKDDVVEVRVLRDDNPFLRHVRVPGEQPRWWLESQSYPIRILDRERVEVLMASEQLARRYGESPVAVTFRYGDGRVLHIISHYYLQRTELRTASEKASGTSVASKLGVSVSGKAAEQVARTPAGMLKDAYSSTQLSANIVVAKQRHNAALRKAYGHVAASDAALRRSPSEASERAATVKRSTPLKILESRGQWRRVRTFTCIEGWLPAASVKAR